MDSLYSVETYHENGHRFSYSIKIQVVFSQDKLSENIWLGFEGPLTEL